MLVFIEIIVYNFIYRIDESNEDLLVEVLEEKIF